MLELLNKEKEKPSLRIVDPEVQERPLVLDPRIRAAASLFSEQLRPDIFGKDESIGLSPRGEEVVDLAIFFRAMEEVRSNLSVAPDTKPFSRAVGLAAANIGRRTFGFFENLFDSLSGENSNLEKVREKVELVTKATIGRRGFRT